MKTDSSGLVLVLALVLLVALGPCQPPTVPPGPPVDPPGPTPVVTQGVASLVVIARAGDLTADQAEVLAELRDWADRQPLDLLSHVVFPPEAAAEDPRVASYVSRVPPEAAGQPYVFLARARVGGGTAILWAGPLPATAREVYQRVMELR